MCLGLPIGSSMGDSPSIFYHEHKVHEETIKIFWFVSHLLFMIWIKDEQRNKVFNDRVLCNWLLSLKFNAFHAVWSMLWFSEGKVFMDYWLIYGTQTAYPIDNFISSTNINMWAFLKWNSAEQWEKWNTCLIHCANCQASIQRLTPADPLKFFFIYKT